MNAILVKEFKYEDHSDYEVFLNGEKLVIIWGDSTDHCKFKDEFVQSLAKALDSAEVKNELYQKYTVKQEVWAEDEYCAIAEAMKGKWDVYSN